eukprot:UN20012
MKLFKNCDFFQITVSGTALQNMDSFLFKNILKLAKHAFNFCFAS